MQYLNDRRERRQRIKDRVHACILCSLIFAIMVAAAYLTSQTLSVLMLGI